MVRRSHSCSTRMRTWLRHTAWDVTPATVHCVYSRVLIQSDYTASGSGSVGIFRAHLGIAPATRIPDPSIGSEKAIERTDNPSGRRASASVRPASHFCCTEPTDGFVSLRVPHSLWALGTANAYPSIPRPKAQPWWWREPLFHCSRSRLVFGRESWRSSCAGLLLAGGCDRYVSCAKRKVLVPLRP